MSRSLAVSGIPSILIQLMPCLTEKNKQRRIYSDVFAKWPKQDLRPDYQFQDVLAKVVDERFKNYKPSIEPEELLKARALQFLVQNKFRDRVRSRSFFFFLCVRGGNGQISLTSGLCSISLRVLCWNQRASRRISKTWSGRLRRRRREPGWRDWARDCRE